MKFLFDLFPVLAFFIAYYIPDDREQAIYIATLVAIIASVIQVGGAWLLTRKVEKMHLITLVIIVVLGAITLLLQDKRFWFWKPTIVNWLFAAVFFASQYIGKRPVIERMLSQAVDAPRTVWLRLNLAWVVFFIIVGLLNIYVAFNFAEHIWVNFKLFGLMGLTLIFALAQAFVLARYMKAPEEQGAEE